MDEKVVVEQEVPDVDELEDVSTTNKSDKTGKTFSQEELTKEIQARVRREQGKFKVERDAWTAEKENLVSQSQEYETVIKEFITEKSKDFAPALKALFDKLSVKEQWDYLKNPDFVVQGSEKKNMPHTPKVGEQEQPQFHRTQQI